MEKNRQKKKTSPKSKVQVQGLSKQKQPPEPSKQQKPEKKPPKQAEQPTLLAGKLQEEVNAKISALSERILTQDKQQEETNAKIAALASAVGSLNEEFTKFLDTLKAQATATSQATPPGVLPSGGNTKPDPVLLPETKQSPPESSKQDRLLAWANILAKLAESGKATEANPTDAMPNSLMQLVNSLKVMGELRKTFLGELKEMINFSKSVDTTVKSPPARPEGTTHLPEE